MRIFFTGPEARKSEVPFLLDASMQPITAANAWLQELAQDGATSSPCSWKTYAYHLFDYFSYLEAQHLDWRQVNNETVHQYRDVQDQNRSGHTKEHLNRRTINARIRTVGRFYAFAFEQGFIEKNSPQPGEVRGRVCRSLHACLFCENCWIFAEDLPATIQYRDRLLSEKKEMTDEAWEALHGAAVRAIDQSILSAFPTEIVKQAELKGRQNPELAPPNTMEGS